MPLRMGVNIGKGRRGRGGMRAMKFLILERKLFVLAELMKRS